MLDHVVRWGLYIILVQFSGIGTRSITACYDKIIDEIEQNKNRIKQKVETCLDKNNACILA